MPYLARGCALHQVRQEALPRGARVQVGVGVGSAFQLGHGLATERGAGGDGEGQGPRASLAESPRHGLPRQVSAALFPLGSTATGSGSARVAVSEVASCPLVAFVFCLSISAPNRPPSLAPVATVRQGASGPLVSPAGGGAAPQSRAARPRGPWGSRRRPSRTEGGGQPPLLARGSPCAPPQVRAAPSRLGACRRPSHGTTSTPAGGS